MLTADQRVRQEAQFALVGKGIESLPTLIELIEQEKEFALSSLHGVWALGQLFRAGFEEASDPILSALQSEQVEIRANAARVAGDVGIVEARDLLISSLEDESNRVVSLAAIALGRICKPGDREAERALFEAVGRNQGSGFEVGLRHSFLSALSRFSTADSLSEVASSVHMRGDYGGFDFCVVWSTRIWLFIWRMLMIWEVRGDSAVMIPPH